MNKKNLVPVFATHPGELIKDELTERKIAVTIPVSDRNLLRDLAHKFGWACML